MYILYYAPGAASQLVHVALLEAGVPHRLEHVDLEGGQQHGAAYRAMNPHGHVPTLIVDGRPQHECAALAMLIAERHPEAALAPAPGAADRADYLELMFYLANSVQPAFRHWFYPQETGGDPAAIKNAAAARIENAWQHLAARLASAGPWLLGDRYSTVDLYATMLMRWSRHLPRPALTFAPLAALAARVTARPAWQRAAETEGLPAWP